MTEHSGDVRISNSQIYALLLETVGEVRSVKQPVQETLLPQVKANTKELDTKVSRRDFEAHVKKMATLEIRVYAAIIGILAAAAGLNISGVL